MFKKKLLVSVSILALSVSHPLPLSALQQDPAVQALDPAADAANQTITSIDALRTSPQGQVYTTVGKVISPFNGWGGQSFYIQNASGSGILIYPRNNRFTPYQIGDVVEITGTLSQYQGEPQLVQITSHKKVEASIEPTLTEASLANLGTVQPATLAKVSNVTVGDITVNDFKSSLFKVTDADGQVLDVLIDNRTKVLSDQVMEKIGPGDVINLTGILAQPNGAFQLRPFSLDHIEVITKAAPLPPTPTPPTEATTTIGAIQGFSHISPMRGQEVTVKDVVVTYVEGKNNFFVQDITPDADHLTSDGISVYHRNTPVKVGDRLTIKAKVDEYIGQGYNEKAETDLASTQLVASSVEVNGSADLPAPIILGQDRQAPANIVDNDGFANFDPQEDAIDYWESMEGMLVAVDNPKILGPIKYKELYVLPGSSGTVLNKAGGVNLRPEGFNTEIIPLLLKSGKTPAKTGDFITGRLVGPVSYSFTNYKVLIDDTVPLAIQDGGLTQEKTTIVKDPEKLSIATYNIENFSANKSQTSDQKVQRIAQSFVTDLNAPDIISIVEVQDNNGSVNDGTTDASQSAQRLIDAIKVAGGPTYTYVDIAPVNNQDGGEEGGNIRTGFLYNADRVSLSEKPKAGANDAIAWQNGELNYSVGKIDPTNPIWQGVRKSLAAEFVFKGEKVVVVTNHLNSKRGDYGTYGSKQPIILQSEAKRHQLAASLNAFADAGLAQNPNANIIMLGDFNDFEFTQTSKLIEGDDMTNLVNRHDASDRFSYFYQGNNQSLDHIFVANHLLTGYEFDMIHVNSAFMEEHGRASDHDPLLVQLAIQPRTQTPPVTHKGDQNGQALTQQPKPEGNLNLGGGQGPNHQAKPQQPTPPGQGQLPQPNSPDDDDNDRQPNQNQKPSEQVDQSDKAKNKDQKTQVTGSQKKILPKTGQRDQTVLISLGVLTLISLRMTKCKMRKNN